MREINLLFIVVLPHSLPHWGERTNNRESSSCLFQFGLNPGFPIKLGMTVEYVFTSVFFLTHIFIPVNAD
jgi:hypothetical protein